MQIRVYRFARIGAPTVCLRNHVARRLAHIQIFFRVSTLTTNGVADIYRFIGGHPSAIAVIAREAVDVTARAAVPQMFMNGLDWSIHENLAQHV